MDYDGPSYDVASRLNKAPKSLGSPLSSPREQHICMTQTGSPLFGEEDLVRWFPDEGEWMEGRD